MKKEQDERENGGRKKPEGRETGMLGRENGMKKKPEESDSKHHMI